MVSTIYEHLEEYKYLEHGFYPEILEAGYKFHASSFPDGIREAIDVATKQISELFGIPTNILYDEILVQDRDDDGFVDFDLSHFSDIYKKATPKDEWIFLESDEFRSLFFKPEDGVDSQIHFTEFFDDSSKKHHLMTWYLRLKAMAKFGKPLHDLPGIIEWFQNNYNGNINSEADLKELALDLRTYLENAFFHPTVNLNDDFLRNGRSLLSLSSTSDGRIRIDCGGFQYVAEQILSGIKDKNGEPLFTIERFHTPGHIYNIAYIEDKLPGLLLETNNEYVGVNKSTIDYYAEVIALVNKNCLNDGKDECKPLVRGKLKGTIPISKKEIIVRRNPQSVFELSLNLTAEESSVTFETTGHSLTVYLPFICFGENSSFSFSLSAEHADIKTKTNGRETSFSINRDQISYFSESMNGYGNGIGFNWTFDKGLFAFLLKSNRLKSLVSLKPSYLLEGLREFIFGPTSAPIHTVTKEIAKELSIPIEDVESFIPSQTCINTEDRHCSLPYNQGEKEGIAFEERKFAITSTDNLSKHELSHLLQLYISGFGEIPECQRLSLIFRGFKWFNTEWHYSTHYETSCDFTGEGKYSPMIGRQEEITPEEFHKIEDIFHTYYESM